MPKLQPEKNNNFRKFLQFSGIGIQLGVMIYLSSLLGEYLDNEFTLKKPWFTLLFIVITIIVFVILLMRQLKKLNNE